MIETSRLRLRPRTDADAEPFIRDDDGSRLNAYRDEPLRRSLLRRALDSHWVSVRTVFGHFESLSTKRLACPEKLSRKAVIVTGC